MSTRRKHGRTGGRKWAKKGVRSHKGMRIAASPAVFPTEISVLSFRFYVTRKHRRWWRQGNACFDPRRRFKHIETALVRLNREKVKQFGRRVRNERLRQNSNLTQDLRRHVENGPLSFRIAFRQCPGCLRCKVTVSIGHDCPNAIEYLVKLLGLHKFARRTDHRVRGRKDGLVTRAQSTWLRQFATACLADH